MPRLEIRDYFYRDESRLTLHEAMMVVLNECLSHTATVQELADRINRLGFYRNRKGGLLTAAQVKRAAKAKTGSLCDRFEFIPPDIIKLL